MPRGIPDLGKPKPWSKQEEEQLTRLWMDGTGLKAIARIMMRTPESVKQRRYKLELPNRMAWARGPTTSYTFRLKEKHRRLLDRRAMERGMNVANYLRMLIERDSNEFVPGRSPSESPRRSVQVGSANGVYYD